MLLNIVAYLAAINLLTYAAFAGDKRAAIRGEWRTSEGTLLMLTLAGGSPAALAARTILRHKTRKEPFRTVLLLIVGAQLGGLILLAIYLALTA